MRKFLHVIPLMSAVLALTSFLSVRREPAPDSDGHVLTSLWKEYAKASDADRPKKEAEILLRIKEQALAGRLMWDYYDAARKYVQVSSRRDWKLREKLEKELEQEVVAYGEPVLTFVHACDRVGRDAAWLLDFVQSHERELKSGKNAAMYKVFSPFRRSLDNYSEILLPLIGNDYEYALWMILGYWHLDDSALENAWALIDAELGGRYPEAAFAEYEYVSRISGEDNRVAALWRLAGKYEGKAAALIPRADILENEFRSMEGKASSDDYLAFRSVVKSYESERRMFRNGMDGAVAKRCAGFASIIFQLEEKSVIVNVHEGKGIFMLRNADSFKVSVVGRDGKTVYDARHDNPAGSFYVRDTVVVEFPVMDDGNYDVRCVLAGHESGGNDVAGTIPYEKKTVSLALRRDAEGLRVYAADYMTGKPVQSASLVLYKGDREVARAEDVRFDGFVPLPGNIVSAMKNGESAYLIQCSFRDTDGRLRMSRKLYIYENERVRPVAETEDAVFAEILKDRAAFRPDDTLRFKGILYNRKSDGGMSVLPQGKEVLARLGDAQGNVVAELPLVTNGFGSVAGEFALGAVRRNGMCSVELLVDGNVAGRSFLRMDEFVLPSFDLSFDKSDVLYFPGDTVIVSGKVKSFSGHRLSGVNAVAIVRVSGAAVSSGPLEIMDDGSFSVSCVAGKGTDSYCPVTVEVKLTDETGETLEFSHYESVGAYPEIKAVFDEKARGDFGLDSEDWKYRGQGAIVAAEKTKVLCEVLRPDGNRAKMQLEYNLLKSGASVKGGLVMSGESVELDFSALSSGVYEFVLGIPAENLRGPVEKCNETYSILKVRDDDVDMDSGVESYFRVIEDDGIVMQFGCGDGPVWAVAELFGDRSQLLDSRLVHLEPASGATGCVGTLRYEYLPEYPDGVVLNVIYFRNGQVYEYSDTWIRRRSEPEMTLEFSRFVDKALPGAECSIAVKTEPGSEVLAAVFDLSSEKIMYNGWNKVLRRGPGVEHVNVSSATGRDGNVRGVLLEGALYGSSVGGGSANGFLARKSVNVRGPLSLDAQVEEEVIYDSAAAPELSAGAYDAGQVAVRDDFSSTLAFMPFIRPSDDGMAGFVFRSGEKLSTFVVSVYAHDRDMRTAYLRKEMLVTLPLKVSVAEPQFLHEGDRYVMRASVSNNSDAEISGVAVFEMYAGKEHAGKEYEGAVPLDSYSVKVAVPAYGTVPVEFEVDVPECGTDGLSAPGMGKHMLGFKVVFAGDNHISDGVFVTVPVYPAWQDVVEAHSGVLLPGMSEEELVGRLRGQFTNMSSAGAWYSERRIADMLADALPAGYRPEGKDVISLSEALYVNILSYGLARRQGGVGPDSQAEDSGQDVRISSAMESISKILSCANEDGGFGWFEGMTSSPLVTAVVLDRYASLRDRGLLAELSQLNGQDSLDDFDEAVCKGVEYLDYTFFSLKYRPLWVGGLSVQQYLYVRSFYAGLPFDASAARKAMGDKEFAGFKKNIKEYLTPSGKRSTGSDVLSLARRTRILLNLCMSEQGREMAGDWGVRVAGRRIARSLHDDVVSLAEYAVEHPSGGWYYPNAVMPWRGLLESEAYAHSVICDLLRDLAISDMEDEAMTRRLGQIADGIRIWIMLQKETQDWKSDSGFAEAVASVYDGVQAIADTKMIVLKKTARKPFGEILTAGNGFRISVGYYKELPDGALVELAEGDNLEVGEKIVAKYSVWSGENRSFVRLDVPRPAAFSPVRQLSGWSGGWFRPFAAGAFTVSPSAYREVRADRTLYWFDVFPEENSVISEEFFVTQEGVFLSAAPQIESVYAPHYRANSSCPKSFAVR
jgi:hypothetical protein